LLKPVVISLSLSKATLVSETVSTSLPAGKGRLNLTNFLKLEQLFDFRVRHNFLFLAFNF
jgi:hypothetical protein